MVSAHFHCPVFCHNWSLAYKRDIHNAECMCLKGAFDWLMVHLLERDELRYFTSILHLPAERRGLR